MRALLAAALLCSGCVVWGQAGLDEHGRPQASAVLVIWSEVRACPIERGEGCATVGAGGLSAEAAGVVKTPGFLRSTWETLKGAVKLGSWWLF